MRPADQQRRAELVAATLRHLGQYGLSDFSLRGLAADLGTSARMLVHYFGSREGLLEQAFAEHRRQMLDAMTVRAHSDLAEAAVKSWRHMTAPAERGHYALMFQIMTASVNDQRYGQIARDSIVAWVDAVAQLLVTAGAEPADAKTRATVLVSGLKGIVLDLLVTGDEDRCQRAAALLIALVGQ